MTMPHIAHIIAAAGSGTRFGAPLPKQFCDLGGRPLLMTTIERMQTGRDKAMILLVLSPDMVEEWLDMCAEHSFTSPAIIEGGATRWESVKNAIDALPASIHIITVHDGARPVVTASLIDRVMNAVTDGHHGALPMTAVTDSIRELGDDGSTHAVDRSRLRAVQTPQAFDAGLLRLAYQLPYSPLFTDDASVMEAAGFTDIVEAPGDPRNIKVTHPGDIEIARLHLNSIDNHPERE